MARGRAPRLSRDALLNIELSAFCSRHSYTTDPGPVVEELSKRAGDRTDILAEVAELWSGFYRDEHTQILADALAEIEDVGYWLELGQRRRGLQPHQTP